MSDTPAVSAALEEGPGFAEPWQAQAFACALALSRRGLFTWREWVDAFGAEIAAHPVQPGESHEAAYYRQWLATLEKLAGVRAGIAAGALDARTEQWRRAYLNTPHGQPVELGAADRPLRSAQAAHGHAGHAPPEPIAVSPPQR